MKKFLKFMLRRNKYIPLFFYVCLLTCGMPLQGHGFIAETPLNTSEGYYYLNVLAELLFEAKTTYHVDSGPVHTGSNEAVPITHIARGTSNCYVRFAVGPYYTDVLCCSPQQLFYVPSEDAWKEASDLVVGDELLTRFGRRKQIQSIELIQQPVDLYAIAVPKPHIFCVGNHGIVTHNMIIPGVMLSVSIPWGFEAGVPLFAGFLGPVTFGISFAIGGLAVLAYTCCSSRPQIHQYELTFDVAALADTVRCHGQGQLQKGSSDLTNKTGSLCICGHSCDTTCLCECSCPCSENRRADGLSKGDVHTGKAEIFEKNAKHIFRDVPGHLLDTLGNRDMLMELASNQKNYLGIDSYGNQWFSKVLSDGRQLWASVRNNLIRNGGINEVPKVFNGTTGLCNLGG